MKRCTNCNNEMFDDAVICTACGVPEGKSKNYCPHCGSKVTPDSDVCTTCGRIINESRKTNAESKSRVIAGLLGIILGSFGLHNFYLGFTSRGCIQIAITILSCGALSFATGIWGFIEGIKILIDENTVDANGNALK